MFGAAIRKIYSVQNAKTQSIADFRLPIADFLLATASGRNRKIGNWQSKIGNALVDHLLGVEMFTSIFCVPPPPNSRPLKTNSATSTMITKITSTATTPALPPPPPSSAMTVSSSCFSLCQGAKNKGGLATPILLRTSKDSIRINIACDGSHLPASHHQPGLSG